MPPIEDVIKNVLDETEIKHDIRIISAVESGSRGWGFASPDSDFDCRFVYLHQQDWYLSVEEGPDFIEYPVDKVFDINGWDLKKALKQIRKSIPVLTEWLFSPIIYRENKACADSLRSLASDYFYPITACCHYLNLANKSLAPIRELPQAKLKKYFYVLRPLACCQYILLYQGIPPMEYAKTISALPVEAAIMELIEELLALKKTSDESYLINKIPLLCEYMESSLLESEAAVKALKGDKNKDISPVNDCFREILKRAWAI